MNEVLIEKIKEMSMNQYAVCIVNKMIEKTQDPDHLQIIVNVISDNLMDLA